MSELYEFQKNDVEKLAPTYRAAIGSEMGTGKTLEAIALEQAWYEEFKGRSLVIAPINTWGGWQEKYSQQAPHVDVTTIDRKNRGRFVEDIRKGRGDVFLMHWDALRLMPELREYTFCSIVADEGHRASNRKTQQTRALKRLRTNSKLIMSGTLSADHPAGLWSPFNWLYPRDFGSYWRFYNSYVEFEMAPQGYHKITGVKNTDKLHEQIDPFYIRHLKKKQCCPEHPEGVMWWLPDKTYDKIWVDLTPGMRKQYEGMRKEMLTWIGEQEDTPLTASIVAVQLLRLSQMALGTAHYKDETGKLFIGLPSPKLDAAKELFDDHPDKQFVVWTSSKQMAYVAHEYMPDSVVLSGDVKSEVDREAVKKRFTDGNCQLFIGVIQAGGEGIDGLQHATDTMVFLDRTWSQRMNSQAEDRLHRGGQKDTVQIIDIMARDTVDLGRFQKLELKKSWMEQLLNHKIGE